MIEHKIDLKTKLNIWHRCFDFLRVLTFYIRGYDSSSYGAHLTKAFQSC